MSLGFDACQFTAASLPDVVRTRLKEALSNDRHGSMTWMNDRVDQRSHPQSLWADATSVIMLGMNYGPDHNPLDNLDQHEIGNISVYARNTDYHDIIKKRLKELGRWMAGTFSCELKVFVDTAPVMEKPLAAQAGLGWQGKHTNLVSKEFGSWLFLGAIYTTLSLGEDEAETDHCGSCRACLDVCPTNAFPQPYQLDAKRCISYLTIEHKGIIPLAFREAMGNRIYGCDDCLAVCPWNKFASQASEAKLVARNELNSPDLKSLSELNDPDFRALFRKSPIKRIGRDRFVRNVMIAIGNSQQPQLRRAILPRLEDEAAEVRAMSVWAWNRLGGSTENLERVAEQETDPDVLAELETAREENLRQLN